MGPGRVASVAGRRLDASSTRATSAAMLADPLGIQMIVGAIVLQVVGALIIRKIVNIEY